MGVGLVLSARWVRKVSGFLSDLEASLFTVTIRRFSLLKCDHADRIPVDAVFIRTESTLTARMYIQVTLVGN